MRYLVYLIFKNESFYTNWFGDELVPDEPYVCFDLEHRIFTSDGSFWKDITEDHL